jgi:hypothetical protein
MVDVLMLLWTALTSLFRSRVRLEAEILVLRQQINVLRRKSPKRSVFRTFDRLVFVGLYRLAPGIVDALAIVRPETVVRWHRAGFRLFWRWKSRRRGGRPSVPLEIRRLIREMSLANPFWGAPRIHGELLKLDLDVGQTSVAKYMARRRGGPSQGWRTFLRNHADGIISIDLFVVPTLSFRLLYGFVILRHRRRGIIWLGVTANPTAEWIAQQLTEACGWEVAPGYIVRDRDRAFGKAYVRRICRWTRTRRFRAKFKASAGSSQNLGSGELGADQALCISQIRIRQVGAVEPGHAKIGAPKIGVPQ